MTSKSDSEKKPSSPYSEAVKVLSDQRAYLAVLGEDELVKDLDAAIESLSSTSRLAAPKPSGEWVRVPREPTPEMHEAGHAASIGADEPMHPDFIDANRAIYTAMLAAAPKPESAEAVAQGEEDGMLPDALVPVSAEWYQLCERAAYVDRISISGDLAEAIVAAVCACTAPPRPEASAPDANAVGVEELAALADKIEDAVNHPSVSLDQVHMSARAVVCDAADQLRALAHSSNVSESGSVQAQPAADAHNRRLKAQLEQEWANLQDLKSAYQTQQPAPDATSVAVDEAMDSLRRGPDRLWMADLVGQQISVDRMREILTTAFAGQSLKNESDQEQQGGTQE